MQREYWNGKVCAISTSAQNSRTTVRHKAAKAGLLQQTGSTLYRLTFSMESPIIKVWKPKTVATTHT